MSIRRTANIFLTLISLALLGLLAWYYRTASKPEAAAQPFDGQRALESIIYQTGLGARTPESAAHAQVVAWIGAELQAAGWETIIQSTERMGHPIQNVIARRSDMPPRIILAAHYDSRLWADRDPNLSKQQQPVPGANDGASGVAVLLELGRVLPKDSVPIWLVFFDAEDNGGIPGWDWVLGSRAFVEGYLLKPQAVVVVDMVGDADLKIFMEKNSDARLRREIWAQAAELGYENVFVPKEKYDVMDDHIPFLEAGIPAVDIIDMNYAYWHTTNDTHDKVSARSLQVVGETLLHWVIQQ